MSVSVTAPAARSVRIDDWSDRLNPVVVREVRQALKSRGFVTVFNLIMLACWATSVLGLAITGPGLDFGRPAMAFFSVYFVSLCFAVGVVIPLQACESVWAERRDGTLEVLTVTSLRTGRVVTGKFAAAATKAALIYAAVGPFIAFTAVLPGFDPVGVAWALSMAAAFAATCWLAGIGFGSLSRSPLAAGVLKLMLTAGLAVFWLPVAFILIALADFASSEAFEFWVWSVFWVGASGLVAVTFKMMAETQLRRDASGHYRDLHPNTRSGRRYDGVTGVGFPAEGTGPLPGMTFTPEGKR